MHINKTNYIAITEELTKRKATLVAVSKTKPPDAIQELYDMGHRDFGENYVQELVDKQEKLPADIRWHFIGHLQTNKVKYIAPFVHLVHGIDSVKLLNEVNRQALKQNRTIDVLLQVHIAKEETKFGFDGEELDGILNPEAAKETGEWRNIRIVGLMGMASFSEDVALVRREFRSLKALYDRYAQIHADNIAFQILSMGMSSDYRIALEEGSNLVRIGSAIFGSR